MRLDSTDQSAIGLISETVKMFKLQAIEKNINFQLDLSEDDYDSAECLLTPSSDQLLPVSKNHTIYADGHKMKQVIRNLVSNAIKFTGEGKPVIVKLRRTTTLITTQKPIEITDLNKSSAWWITFVSMIYYCGKYFVTNGHRQPIVPDEPLEGISPNDIENNASGITADDCVGTLVLSVIDGGVGMDPNDLQRLFKEIVQFNPGELQAGGGSGLGMMITKGIVDLHGGEISVQSDGIGHGSTFTVKLPLYSRPFLDRRTPGRLSRSSMRSLRKSVNMLRSMSHFDEGTQNGTSINDNTSEKESTFLLHVLIVDDSHLNRKMMTKLLHGEGIFTCEDVDDGEAAFEIMKNTERRNAFDIILMDFMMPKMDGPTATKAIRELGYTGLIFGVTGNALEEDIEHFLSSGADRVLTKPLDVDLMNSLIKHHFDTQSRLDEIIGNEHFEVGESEIHQVEIVR